MGRPWFQEHIAPDVRAMGVGEILRKEEMLEREEIYHVIEGMVQNTKNGHEVYQNLGLNHEDFAAAVCTIFGNTTMSRDLYAGISLGIAIERAWNERKEEIQEEFTRQLEEFGKDDPPGVV